jgi:hypothetical protein
MKRILFFSPNAAIWLHAFPEALLAESLRKSGHAITYVTCGEVFRNHCDAMHAHNVAPDAPEPAKAAVCSLCHLQDGLLRENLQLPGSRLVDVIDEADVDWAKAMTAAAPEQGFADYEVDGLPVGRAALYVILLHSKKVDLDLDDKDRAIYRVELFNTLLALAAAKKLFARHRPERVVIYNALYPVNQIVYHYAESQGVPCYSLHAGANLAHRLQFIFLTRRYTFDFFFQQIRAWPRFKSIPASEESIALTADHFETLLKGGSHWAFSAASDRNVGDLRARFGVPAGAKVLVAAMSSYDERFAAEAVRALPDDRSKLLFPRQVDWIKAVVDHVRTRPDLFFIIRVHPREFRGFVSDHARQLQAVFETLPPNVRVNWPTDNVSIFDLAEITDVFLNAWSSAGKEMSLFGVPVLLYSKDLVLYPPSLNYVGDGSRDHYFAELARALADGWRADRVVEAFRWYALEHSWSQLDLRGSYPLPERTPLGVQGRQLLRAVVPGAEARLDVHQRAATLPQARLLSEVMERGADSLLDVVDPESFRTIGEAQELAAIRAQLRRLLTTWHGEVRPSRSDGLHARLAAFAAG